MASTNRESENLSAALKPVQGSGEVRFGDRWRARERPFPLSTDATCLVLEFYDAAAGWTPKMYFSPDGTLTAA